MAMTAGLGARRRSISSLQLFQYIMEGASRSSEAAFFNLISTAVDVSNASLGGLQVWEAGYDFDIVQETRSLV